jgi:hypothetical protein
MHRLLCLASSSLLSLHWLSHRIYQTLIWRFRAQGPTSSWLLTVDETVMRVCLAVVSLVPRFPGKPRRTFFHGASQGLSSRLPRKDFVSMRLARTFFQGASRGLCFYAPREDFLSGCLARTLFLCASQGLSFRVPRKDFVSMCLARTLFLCASQGLSFRVPRKDFVSMCLARAFFQGASQGLSSCFPIYHLFLTLPPPHLCRGAPGLEPA